MNETYNFKVEPYDYQPKVKGSFLDIRNGIKCINPSADLECYLNYIEYLNLNRDRWKSYGYLDLGMMPLVMGPSFFHSFLVDSLVSVMTKFQIHCHSMPPVSMMYESCKLAENDIWLFKTDVMKVTKIPEDKLTLERLIRWCME